MTLRILISLSLLLFAWQKAGAQLAPAEDFFNGGAQLYVLSNNIPAALERVENGLKTYPDDQHLKDLEKLLKQQQQQQQQQNQQQQNQQQQNQQSQQNSQNQQKQDEQKQKEAEQKKQEQQKQQAQQQQQSSAQKKDNEKQDQQQAEAQRAQAKQMAPEDAKRLLDSQKNNEQVLQLNSQQKPRNPLHTIKDW